MFPPLSGHRGSVRRGLQRAHLCVRLCAHLCVHPCVPTPAFGSHDDASTVPMLALLSADLFNRRLCSYSACHAFAVLATLLRMLLQRMALRWGFELPKIAGASAQHRYGFIRAIQRTGERINARKDKRVQANEEEFP